MGIENAFFVDSGLSYFDSYTPTTTCTGLWHLEGETVSILADGVVLDPQVVTNGQVTLDTPAYKVHVGLPYVSDFQSLPAGLERTLALGQTTRAAVNKVILRMLSSGPVNVGPSFSYLTETLPIPGNDAGDLQTGRIEVVVEPAWGDDACACVRNTEPLPVEILSLALDVAKGG